MSHPFADMCTTCGSPKSSKGPDAYCSMCEPPQTPEQKQSAGIYKPIMDKVDKKLG